MKLFRFALNIWITIASLVSFLLGWVFLAHAPKPVQPQQARISVVSPAVALPTLSPLNIPSGGNSGNGFQNFQVQVAPPPVVNNFNSAPAPIFHSSGS